MSTIVLTGVEFYGYHGVSEAERAVGHRFEVDVDVEANENASMTDDVVDTVDYGAIARIIVEVGRGPSFHTVERLARVMADRILAGQPAVLQVTIEVVKLLPPIPAIARTAGARITVGRVV